MPALKEGADGTGPADAPHCAQARSEGVNFAPHSLQKLGIFVCWLPKRTRTSAAPLFIERFPPPPAPCAPPPSNADEDEDAHAPNAARDVRACADGVCSAPQSATYISTGLCWAHGARSESRSDGAPAASRLGHSLRADAQLLGAAGGLAQRVHLQLRKMWRTYFHDELCCQQKVPRTVEVRPPASSPRAPGHTLLCIAPN